MAYSSNSTKKTWKFDYDGDTFNDRVGRLLSGGHDLRNTSKAEAARSANYLHDLEKEQASGGANSLKGSDKINSVPQSKAPTPDGRGMVWVDPNGNVLGACSEKTFKEPFKPSSNLEGLNEKQTQAATMRPIDRSMHIWKRVQPGVMESTTKVPKPTMKDHFQYDPASAHKTEADMKHHLKKSDFTEYIENKLKVGNAIT